MILLNMVLR